MSRIIIHRGHNQIVMSAYLYKRTSFFRLTLVLLFLTCTLTGLGQQQDDKDFRTELDLPGNFPAFALAPNGNCWLLSGNNGHAYYTEDIQSDWHCATPLYPADNRTWKDINDFSFFDSTTAIAIAYDNWGKQSYCYLTEDQCKSWSQLLMDKKLTLEQICMDAQGHAWLTGSGYDHILFYSDDKGKTFTPLKLPVAPTDWALVTTLDMRDGQYGLAGLNIKHDTFPLLLTEDNWRTTKQISTPMGNGKNIDKVLLWNDLWIIRQGKEVFFTSSQNILWQHFPIKVTDFYLDRETNKLIAITDKNEVMVFTSPTNYRLFTPEPLPAKPAAATMHHGTLYVWAVGRILCKADEHGIISVSNFYTTEIPIRTPDLVREGNQHLWGIDFRNVLYLADKSDGKWYRQERFPMKVKAFQLLSDSVSLIWDGQQHYTYSLADRQLRDYLLPAPLEDFLAAPITEVLLCGGYTYSHIASVHYRVNPNGQLQTTHAFSTKIHRKHNCQTCPFKINRKKQKFQHEASRNKLDSILRDINRDYSRMPTPEEMQITEQDRQKYYELLGTFDFLFERKFMNPKAKDPSFDDDIIEDFYRKVPDQMDTLSANTLRQILYKNENLHSTGGAYWFNIQLVNSNGDTLRFDHYNFDNEYAWYLPWMAKYNGMPFRCYNIALSHWVSDCLPKKFYGKECFDNARFLLQIADYLWIRKQDF